MTVEDLLRRKGTSVVWMRPSATIKSVAERLRLENIAAVVIAEGPTILGLISEREIVRALARYRQSLLSMTAGEVMTRIVACAPTDNIRRVMAMMTEHRVRHLVVLRDGGLAGIISIGDVLKHRLSDLELETGVLRDAYVAFGARHFGP